MINGLNFIMNEMDYKMIGLSKQREIKRNPKEFLFR